MASGESIEEKNFDARIKGTLARFPRITRQRSYLRRDAGGSIRKQALPTYRQVHDHVTPQI